MSEIPQDLVENTWQEVARWHPARAGQEMDGVSRRQPGLLAFVLDATQDLSPAAHELAVYLFFVILRIFDKASGRRLRPVKEGKIARRLQENEHLAASPENGHPQFLERAALREISGQPFVVKYLVEALFEAPEGDDPVVLTEEEEGELFLVLKTVIDVLDEALRKAKRRI